MFSTEAFKAWAKKNVVLLEIDSPKRTPLEPKQKQHNEKVKSKFNSEIPGYPTILFIDAKEKVLGKLVGYRSGSGPAAWIKQAEQQIK